MARIIDVTPTWCEWGNIYVRLVESGQVEAVKKLKHDLARALSAAQALQEMTLTGAQAKHCKKVMEREMKKMGFDQK